MGFKKSISTGLTYLGEVPVIGGIFKPKEKVAIIRFSGVIADQGMRRNSISHERYLGLIEDAFELHKLQAVALAINCPGGSPAQSALIGNSIRRLAEEKNIPVLAFTEDVAASGGYWLACAADEIYAQESSIVGSIGVISASFGFQDLIARYGIERRVHTSGKNKGFLDPFQEEKPEDVKRLKGLQQDIHDIFKDWVRSRRGEKLNADEKTIFEGQFWTAATALSYGIIDGVGDLRSVCKERYGKEIKFVDLSPDRGFFASLFSSKLSNSGLLQQGGASLAQDMIDTAEERAIWGRYGL